MGFILATRNAVEVIVELVELFAGRLWPVKITSVRRFVIRVRFL